MIRLAVRVRRADAELALAELLTLAPAGVEEADLGDEVEYAIYGAPGELPDLGDVEAAAAGALVSVSSREVPDDWGERWKAFHRPLVLGDRLAVRPPWWPPTGAAIEVVIDPGQAFGTGAHATTRLCLELLLDLPPAGELLDLGCGSGVLAIAAAKLGWGRIRAVDHDALAVAATEANAAVNGVALAAERADLRTDLLPAEPTVVANLLRPLLLAYADRLGAGGEAPAPSGADGPRPVRVPERLVAGGLLVVEADEIAAAFAPHRLRETARRERDGWAALLLEGP